MINGIGVALTALLWVLVIPGFYFQIKSYMNRKPDVPLYLLLFRPWTYYWCPKGLTAQGIAYQKKASRLLFAAIPLLLILAYLNIKYGLWN